MLKSFLEVIGTYKELLLLIVTVMGGILFVLDYFATKEEVEVLKCQVENGIAIMESRMNGERLVQDLIERQKAIEEGKSRQKAARADTPEDSQWLIAQNLEVEQLKNELEAERSVRRHAAENLKPGMCESAARSNK
jgi:hypothetical protein